jgi:diguanylate cyclase (GGDEF)-like protein
VDLARRVGRAASSGSGPDVALVLEAAAGVVEANRVSFWRFDADHRTLRCEHLFLRDEGRLVKAPSPELPVLSDPRCFDALAELRSIGPRETSGDPVARDLLAPYLTRNRVTSMFTAPVRVAGRLVGVVGLENVGDPLRAFSPEDAAFADAIADLTALAVESELSLHAEERTAVAALHDPLTDLPGRSLFTERVERSLRGLERRNGLVAVLSVGLDGLPDGKQRGHTERDEALVAVARAITGVLRPADLPARLGSEVFGILVDRLDEPWEAIAVAERVLQALSRPLPAPDDSAIPRASIGVALAHDSNPKAAPDLLADAEAAREQARARGGGRYEVLESSIRGELLERMSLGWALHDALPAGQLVLEYQPELSLKARRLLGVEALLRWDRPGHGRLVAGSFIDLAERIGLIVPIGVWVLKEACRRVKSWREDPRAVHLGLRVNLSARQFERADVVDTVAAALEDSGLPAEALGLEITETVLMSNAAAALGTLTALKALGVGLAVDDFGIGYSSLAYLKRFPVDTLKIDRSFVEGLGNDPIDLPIVQAVMSLGRTLGLEVVAEGVETPLQEQTLKALGCERAQGFLYSPAVPAEQVPSFFDRR